MKKRMMQYRHFKCPCCGVVMTAPKRASRKTKDEHIKDIWCYKCQKIQKFIQLTRWE